MEVLFALCKTLLLFEIFTSSLDKLLTIERETIESWQITIKINLTELCALEFSQISICLQLSICKWRFRKQCNFVIDWTIWCIVLLWNWEVEPWLYLICYKNQERNIKWIKGKMSVNPFTTLWHKFSVLATARMKAFENIIGKGENAGSQHPLLFQQSFLPLSKTSSTV